MYSQLQYTNRLVERDWGTKKGVNDIRVVVQLFVNHEGEDSHLCCAAIV